MPKKPEQDADLAKRREHVASGVLVCTLGCLWLAAEKGIISTSLPLGPIIIVITGLAIMAPWLRK